MEASFAGRVEMVRWLPDTGADIDALSKLGETRSWARASAMGRLEVVLAARAQKPKKFLNIIPSRSRAGKNAAPRPRAPPSLAELIQRRRGL